MNDQEHIKWEFEKECREKKNIGHSASKRVGLRKGCKLPSDYLTTSQKRKLNGEVIIMNINKPMAHEEFLKLSKEMQIEYLQNLINNHNGNLITIADMFGVTKPALVYYIKKHLDNAVRARHGGWGSGPNKKWMDFLAGNIEAMDNNAPESLENATETTETVETTTDTIEQYTISQDELEAQAKAVEEWMDRPIRSFKAFRMRNKYQQEQYLNRLVYRFDGSIKRIAEMMNIPKSELQKHIGKSGIQVDPKEAENNRKPRDKWICFMEGIEYYVPVKTISAGVIESIPDIPNATIREEEFSCAEAYVDGSPVMKSARLVFAMHDTSSLKEILDFVKKIGIPLKGTVTFEINV